MEDPAVTNSNRICRGSKLALIGVAFVSLAACSSGGGHRTVRESERVYRQNGEVCREVEVVERDRSRRDRDNRVAGTVAGAVVGGVVGHQFGSGRGNDAATVGGAAAGAYAGNRIASDHDDRGRVREREVTTECTRRSRY
jgi:uncharacterized protein YcfJ